MILNHMLIGDRDDLHQCFSIEKLHGVSPYAYLAFTRELHPTCAVDLTILGLLDKHGTPAFSSPPVWLRGGTIDTDDLIKTLERLSHPLFKGFAGRNQESILSLVRAAEAQDAALLYLFLLQHIQAMRDITQAGMAYMEGRLSTLRKTRLASAHPKLAGCIASPGIRRLDLSLGHPMQGIPVIRRLCSSGVSPLRVHLSSMQRTLFYQETLYFMETEGTGLFFLPRNRDWSDEAVRSDYCRRMWQALADGAAADMPLEADDLRVKPILDENGCAGYLLRSGRVYADGRLLETAALDAAADTSALYLAARDGVMRVSRSSGSVQLLFKTDTPVEELDVKAGSIVFRCESASQFLSHPIPAENQEGSPCR